MSDPTREPIPPTPAQTVGPFFGYALPYARGNELVEPGTPGAVRLHGTVYDGAGAPVPDALIEIWQTDPAGAVVARSGSLLRDGTFTGWGRAETDREGCYWFRTLEPGATEPGRAPFFAVTVFARGLQDRLFTRAYLPEDDGAGPGVDAVGPGADAAGTESAGAWPCAEPLLASLEPERRATLVTSRETDGSLRFDIRLQGGPHGEEETVFLTYDLPRTVPAGAGAGAAVATKGTGSVEGPDQPAANDHGSYPSGPVPPQGGFDA
ncbi:protocatechuate 3,4-dioxygenase subunit alpha [Promicromonospora kroppenstedtii]|uniref:protocatechuate 3,4-dioxygenase subunit alpha n=1 Tax=Promicromonospora kroppenstedtii TaxID=440482 RepID=UPI0004BCA737